MKKQLFTLLATVTLLSACGGGGAKVSTLEFTYYEKEVDETTPEYISASLLIRFAVPQGEGEALITTAEKEIVAAAMIAEVLGAPEGETLQAIADNYESRFKSGMAEGKLDAPRIYHLEIACLYQDSQAVVFNVTDGVYGNGGPQEYLRIVSLADGLIIERNALTTMTDADVRNLALQFADNDTKEFLRENEHEDFWIAPDSTGCRVKLQTGSHFFTDFVVPVESMVSYLTDKGKALFGGTDGGKATKADESVTVEEGNVPGRGDLGGYDLRGPVKKVAYQEWNVAFDEQGRITAENGQSLNSIFPGGVKRDKDGRLTECNADGYGSRYYTYNAKGLPTEIAEDGYSRKLTYDADGYLATETATMAPEIGDEEGEPEVITYKYTIIEKDGHGNWTKRKDQDGNITTRKITYYK